MDYHQITFYSNLFFRNFKLDIANNRFKTIAIKFLKLKLFLFMELFKYIKYNMHRIKLYFYIN